MHMPLRKLQRRESAKRVNAYNLTEILVHDAFAENFVYHGTMVNPNQDLCTAHDWCTGG